MDNQIALYEAVSYNDILSGEYTLLGANDDRSDADYRPLIINESVHPGEMYWIQVDGSGGGLEDDFYMTITELSATSADAANVKQIQVYPQPAGDRIFMYHPDWTKGIKAEVAVFNSAGIRISSETINTYDGTISVSTAGWSGGVYIAAVKTGSNRYVAHIVKK